MQLLVAETFFYFHYFKASLYALELCSLTHRPNKSRFNALFSQLAGFCINYSSLIYNDQLV